MYESIQNTRGVGRGGGRGRSPWGACRKTPQEGFTPAELAPVRLAATPPPEYALNTPLNTSISVSANPIKLDYSNSSFQMSYKTYPNSRGALDVV